MLLILAWACIISFSIIMYVILDGFDLGIGILFPWIKNSQHRDIMVSTILPVWDGNETWLVMGGASLYAAFPIAYSSLLPALYLPLMVMLASLVFRGIAFEFRFKAHKSRFVWDYSFAVGSIVAAFSQGLILGTLVEGYGTTLPLAVAAYEWFSPFSVMTGVAVVVGYALLGSTWLIAKTAGELQTQMFTVAKRLLPLLVLFLIVVSLWTPFIDPYVMARWFSFPNIIYLSPLPLLTALVVLVNFYALHKRAEFYPFALSIALFILAYAGFCISDYPYIIPHAATIWQSASPPSSLKFNLVGVMILLPILVIYTFYSYHVFRGKVTEVEHY